LQAPPTVAREDTAAQLQRIAWRSRSSYAPAHLQQGSFGNWRGIGGLPRMEWAACCILVAVVRHVSPFKLLARSLFEEFSELSGGRWLANSPGCSLVAPCSGQTKRAWQLSAKLLISLVAGEGLEPPTRGL